jgi:hypothetical protein
MVRYEMALLGAACVAAGLLIWGWRRTARQTAGLLAGALAVLLPRAIYDRLATGDWLPDLRAPRAIEWAGLAVPLAPVLVIAACWWTVTRQRTPPRRIASALWGLVLVSALGQAFALRHVAGQRRLHAGMLARVQAAAGEEGVVLSDVADASRLLLPVARVLPALYVRPKADLSTLSERIQDAAVTPYWITRRPEPGDRLERPATLAVRSALRRDEAIELGDGLVLLRYDMEGGVRGFARLPKGD